MTIVLDCTIEGFVLCCRKSGLLDSCLDSIAPRGCSRENPCGQGKITNSKKQEKHQKRTLAHCTTSPSRSTITAQFRQNYNSYIDTMTSVRYSSLLFLLAMMMVGAATATAAVDYSGTFTLTTTQKDGTRLSLGKEADEDHVVVVYLTQMDESNYNLGVKVANTLRAHVSIDENNKLEMGPVMSTRMMPPPELRPMEDFLSEYLPTLEEIDFEDQDHLKLKLTGPRVELTMERQQDWES